MRIDVRVKWTCALKGGCWCHSFEDPMRTLGLYDIVLNKTMTYSDDMFITRYVNRVLRI